MEPIASRPGRTRTALILIWWLSCLANLGIVFYLYNDGWIFAENFQQALQVINTLYSPYLGTITLYVLGDHDSGIKKPGKLMRAGNILAVCCSILWNCMILFFTARLLFGIGTIEDSLEIVEKLGGIFAWLVAPSLGIYFAASSSTRRQA
jgi:hypothetical protein